MVSSHSRVQMNITQSMETSLVDGYNMCLTCMASVVKDNVTHDVNMRWSGAGLQQSLWVNQLQIVRGGNCIVRKLCFTPWLSSHAGEYTCHVDLENGHNLGLTRSKTFTINGMPLYSRNIFWVQGSMSLAYEQDCAMPNLCTSYKSDMFVYAFIELFSQNLGKSNLPNFSAL